MPLNIVYYTSGMTGSGRIVTGIAIGNALRRNGINCRYTILSSSSFANLSTDFEHEEIPFEDEKAFSRENHASSILYNTLIRLKPDVLLIDLLWFPLFHFIERIECVKILLCRQVHDRFFSIKLTDETLIINPAHFNMIIATEPYKSSIEMSRINPIVIRNRNEIFSREEALKRLNLNDGNQICLFAYNGHPEDFERVRKKYTHLDEFYTVVYSTNYRGGIFPAVDYFNAFDFIVSGAGYNAFWEIIYFNKEAVFEPTETVFEDQTQRIRDCQEFYFDINGSDQLAGIIARF